VQAAQMMHNDTMLNYSTDILFGPQKWEILLEYR